MTPASPTWADSKRFLAADGWREIPGNERGGSRQRHVFYEKVLDDGRVLGTSVSHTDDKTISAGRFGGILGTQLEVSRHDFWGCVRTQTPVDRPVTVEPAPVEHDLWVVQVLVGELHLTPEQISELSAEEAVERVHKHWQGG